MLLKKARPQLTVFSNFRGAGRKENNGTFSLLESGGSSKDGHLNCSHLNCSFIFTKEKETFHEEINKRPYFTIFPLKIYLHAFFCIDIVIL